MRISLVLDCLDPDALAPFWCTAMGYDVVESIDQYAVITPGVGEPSGPAVILQGVPESKLGKNRAHIDVHTQELDAHIAVLESMGGHRVGTQLEGYGMRWQPMVDPEGNEFCVAMHAEAADEINTAD